MHIVLLSLAVAQLAAARQYFQHPAEVRVAPAEYPSNTAHGVWKPQRSPWLNDSPPPERNRRVGRRDFSDLVPQARHISTNYGEPLTIITARPPIAPNRWMDEIDLKDLDEPVAESSIEMKVESQELLTSSENVKGGTKRIVKHITSLEPSGYNGGNEGNNLEAWQSVNSDHGGVFPDGYDGLSAMPRTLINEVVSSSGNPLPIPPPPPPRNYPQFPPPPSRRHIIDMNPPGFVPPDMSASSPLSGDFGGEEFLDRSGRDSGDAGGPLTTTPATTTPFDKGEEGAEAAGSDPFDTNLDDISETTPDTVEEVTTQSTTESTTTASTTTTTTTTEEPDTTPSVVEDLPVEVGQAIEQEQAVAVFTMKSPVAPPIFENSVTALFEEPDDDSLEDPVIIKKSTLPNGGGAKRSASYSAPQNVDNQAEESRNTKLNCLPCAPGQVAVPPKEERLPPIAPLPSVHGPYQPPPIRPIGPGEPKEPHFVNIHEPDTPAAVPSSPASVPTPPVALPSPSSVPSPLPRAPPSQTPIITIALPAPQRPVAPSPSYGPAPAQLPSAPSQPEEPSSSSSETSEDGGYGPAPESPSSGPSGPIVEPSVETPSRPAQPAPYSPSVPVAPSQPEPAPSQPETSYGPASAPSPQPAPSVPTMIQVSPPKTTGSSSVPSPNSGSSSEYGPPPSVSESKEQPEPYSPESPSPNVEPAPNVPQTPAYPGSETPSVEQPSPPSPASPSPYGTDPSAPDVSEPSVPEVSPQAPPAPPPAGPSSGPLLPPPLPPLPGGPAVSVVQPSGPETVPPVPSPSYGPAPGTNEVESGPPPGPSPDNTPPEVPVMIALPPPKSAYSGGDEDNGGEEDVSQEQVNPSDRRPELSSVSAENSYENISKNKNPTVPPTSTTGRMPSSVHPSRYLSENQNLEEEKSSGDNNNNALSTTLLPTEFESNLKGTDSPSTVQPPPSPSSSSASSVESGVPTTKGPIPPSKPNSPSTQGPFVYGPPAIIPPFATVPPSLASLPTKTTSKPSVAELPTKKTTIMRITIRPLLPVASATPEDHPSTATPSSSSASSQGSYREVTQTPSIPPVAISTLHAGSPQSISPPSSQSTTASAPSSTTVRTVSIPTTATTVTSSLPSSSPIPGNVKSAPLPPSTAPVKKVTQGPTTVDVTIPKDTSVSLNTKSPQTGTMDNSGEVISVEEPTGRKVSPVPSSPSPLPPAPRVSSAYGPPSSIPPYALTPKPLPPSPPSNPVAQTKMPSLKVTSLENGFMKALPPSEFPDSPSAPAFKPPSFGSGSQMPTTTDTTPMKPLEEDYDVDEPLPTDTTVTGSPPPATLDVRQSLITSISSAGKPASIPDWIMAMYTKSDRQLTTATPTPAPPVPTTRMGPNIQVEASRIPEPIDAGTTTLSSEYTEYSSEDYEEETKTSPLAPPSKVVPPSTLRPTSKSSPTAPPSAIPPWAVSPKTLTPPVAPPTVTIPTAKLATSSDARAPTSLPLGPTPILVTAGSSLPGKSISSPPSTASWTPSTEVDDSSEVGDEEDSRILPEDVAPPSSTGFWTSSMTSKYISMQPRTPPVAPPTASGPVPPVTLPTASASPAYKRPTAPPSAIPPWALSTEARSSEDLVPPLATMYISPDVSPSVASVKPTPPANPSSVRQLVPVTASSHFTVNQSKPSITTPASVAPSESTSTSSQSPAPIVVTAGTSSTTKEHGNEEGPYEPLNPPQPAETGNAEEYESTVDTVVETSATSAPAPQPVPSGPIEHNYGIPSSGPAPAAPQVPEPVPTAAPQPAEHTYGAQGPDIAPIPTAAPYSPPEVPQAPINPGPAPVNPSQSIAVAPEPIGNTNIESAEHIDAKPSYPGQSSYSNLEEDHEDGNVAELPGPGPAPERTPAPSVPGESNFGNLEEDHEDYHPVEGSKSGPAPVPVVQTSGGSSYSNLEEDNEPSTGTSGSSYRGNHHSTESENENEKESESETDTDSESETDSETETTTETHGKSDEEQEYDNEAQHTAGETDDSGESISNIDKEPVPQVVVPTRTGGGYRTGGTIESTAPEPKGYQRPQPIRVQVNPATVPYRPRPSPAPRIQPPRPYNPQPIPIPQPQPQPQPYVQRPSLHLPYQPQQPRYPQPVPFQPRPAPFVPSFQPLPQRPSPSGCCGGQLFSQQGGLCMPISFNPCQQQSNCGGGGGCGGGCGGGGNSCGGGCGGGGSSCGGGCGSSCGGGGGGCGGGCGGGGGGCSPSCCQPQTSACCNQAVSTCCQPQQMPCCNQQVQTCCPPPVQRSCCCPPPSSICRHKRSLGYAMGICQRRRA